MSAGVIMTTSLNRHQFGKRKRNVLPEVTALAEQGWKLDISHRTETPELTVVYDASAFQAIDVFAVWEAPTTDAAVAGINRLESIGWSSAFPKCRWAIGACDMALQPGTANRRHDLGFLAFWNWNEAWHQASTDERRAYDAECDVAFHWDLSHGIDILGRFATAAVGGWDHVALWEVENIDRLSQAMGAHEHQRDFMFTTSNHLIGRRTDLVQLGA